GEDKDKPETSRVIEATTLKNEGSLKEEHISSGDTPVVDLTYLESIMPVKEKSILDQDENKYSSADSTTLEKTEHNIQNGKSVASSSSSETFQLEGLGILMDLFDNELFPRIFKLKIYEFDNDLHQMAYSLKTKKDVLTGKFGIKSQQEIQKLWGKKRILSWNKQNLDLNFMNYLSSYFRINEKDNHLGLESLQLELFKMIIFFRREVNYLTTIIYVFLRTELNEVEAFRRMLTFSKQFYQVFIENIKERLRDSPRTPSGLFENSKSGEFEKTFDYLGYYGINPERIITKELYDFYVIRNTTNCRRTLPFYTKYLIHAKILGSNECRDRSSPRILSRH
ncbi:hypothetical protein VP01_359g3, partial [Puccinia sorghi]